MRNLKYWIGFLIIVLVTIWSGVDAYETTLWFLEAGICLVGMIALIATFKKFRFTDITYFVISLEFIVLLIGAHYSYARVPLFDWLKDVFDLNRNNYDKVGHFMQGFAPAFISREIIIRLGVVQKRGWIAFFVVCISLSISAFYEMIEWWMALLFEGSAEDFLGMQGFEWDTQSDMLFALIGATCMVVFFSKFQNKQIDRLLTNDKA